MADAVRDHYKPVGPSDTVPTAPVTVAVALADKLDSLVGFFAIDERPTGSKDPYALRRAALGIIRIILGSEAKLSLQALFRNADRARTERPAGAIGKPDRQIATDLLAFFADRLKVLLRDEGRRHDLVDAVFALGDDDLVRIVARVEALSDFLATEDGANLLAGYTRATNILRAEEKKGAPLPASGETPAERLDSPPEQVALQQALRTALSQVQPRVQAEDFAGAMAALAALRRPVDAFFDRVLVNDPDPEVRLERLRLLNQVREAADQVADFSRIQG